MTRRERVISNDRNLIMGTVKLDRSAMKIPLDGLVEALVERISARKAILEERDACHGADRVKISSYMENIALPELFGFDMNDIFRSPEFALETELRNRIFWLDNTHDDWVCDLSICANAGMYYDMTLFGMDVKHSPQGVPEFMPHPIAAKADLSLIPPFEFYKTGVMPGLIRHYEKLQEISHKLYKDKLKILFPSFHRGPLDIAIQMRGYDRFIEDTYEDPVFVENFLNHIVWERIRYNRERGEFLGEKFPPESTFIADDWVNIPFITPGFF